MSYESSADPSNLLVDLMGSSIRPPLLPGPLVLPYKASEALSDETGSRDSF